MADRKRRVVLDDDEEGYVQRTNGSQRNNQTKRSGQSSGSRKRLNLEEDSDHDPDSYAPKHIRPATAPGPSSSSSTGTLRVSSSSSANNILPEDFERLVKDVVRLAIFTSHSEAALKKEDIKSVLSDHTRLFDAVFSKAQDRLRDVFGMEMVELTTKGRGGNAVEKGTKSYMLRNILPIELLSAPVVDWENELEDMGLLMVVLSLVMVRQGAIYESALISQLRRLCPADDSSVMGDPYKKQEVYIQKKLDLFIKKRYLEKSKLDHLDDSGEKAEMEVRWSARARVEFPESHVVQFIKEVFGAEAPLGLEASILKASGMQADAAVAAPPAVAV